MARDFIIADLLVYNPKVLQLCYEINTAFALFAVYRWSYVKDFAWVLGGDEKLLVQLHQIIGRRADVKFTERGATF